MIRIIFLVMLPLAWSYGAYPQGGGAYAYADSAGNRYGGTYGLKDKFAGSYDDAFPVPFSDNVYQGDDDFGSSYFSNLENLLQEVFKSSVDNQRLAFNAAKKAFDLTSNHAAGYNHPNIASRFPAFNDFPPINFPFAMPHPGSNFQNSAFASASAGPGYQHHVAQIFPNNPNNPNVDQINRYSDTSVPNTGGNGGFYAVSSNAFSSSSNVNGKETSNRGGETVVNDNGRVTRYKVNN